MSDFVVVGKRYRAWRDPARCSHGSDDICATCDFDRYYATSYPGVPWAAEVNTTPTPEGEPTRVQ